VLFLSAGFAVFVSGFLAAFFVAGIFFFPVALRLAGFLAEDFLALDFFAGDFVARALTREGLRLFPRALGEEGLRAALREGLARRDAFRCTFFAGFRFTDLRTDFLTGLLRAFFVAGMKSSSKANNRG
jgi:hypothetical protein